MASDWASEALGLWRAIKDGNVPDDTAGDTREERLRNHRLSTIAQALRSAYERGAREERETANNE
jgi:hypothetical protein